MLSWVRYIIDKQLYDAEFVMKWTNLPYLVNPRTKMALRGSDLKNGGDAASYVVWDKKTNSAKPLAYPWDDSLQPALEGAFMVNGLKCKTGFTLLRERAEPYTLDKAGEICWLEPRQIEKAVKLYAQTPSGISLGVATDQNPNSVQAAMGAVVLNAIMGNVERPGSLMQRFGKSGVIPWFMYPFGPARSCSLRNSSLNVWAVSNTRGFCNGPRRTRRPSWTQF